MAYTDVERLRTLLGESIPTGGSAEDTNFTAEELDNLLTEHGGVPEDCLVEGWQIKAGKYAALVDVTEGESSRKMSALHQAAIRMARMYQDQGVGVVDPVPNKTTTRIHRIQRPGFQG